jgi:hypothetical protein
VIGLSKVDGGFVPRALNTPHEEPCQGTILEGVPELRDDDFLSVDFVERGVRMGKGKGGRKKAYTRRSQD